MKEKKNSKKRLLLILLLLFIFISIGGWFLVNNFLKQEPKIVDKIITEDTLIVVQDTTNIDTNFVAETDTMTTEFEEEPLEHGGDDIIIIEETDENFTQELWKEPKRKKYSSKKLSPRTWWESLSLSWQTELKKHISIYREPNDKEILKIINLSAIRVYKNYGITELKAMERFKKLKTLRCSYTKIRSLDYLRNVSNLTDLRCYYTNITSLSVLENAKRLKKLDCSDTEVESLTPIQNLTELEYLDCSNTFVKTLDPLRNLRNLRVVSCEKTLVKSLEPLFELKNLKALFCDLALIEKDELETFKLKNPNCKINVKSSPYYKALKD